MSGIQYKEVPMKGSTAYWGIPLKLRVRPLHTEIFLYIDVKSRFAGAGFEPRLRGSGIRLTLNTALSGTSLRGSACCRLGPNPTGSAKKAGNGFH